MKIALKMFKIGEGMGMRSGLCGSGSCGAVGLVWCWGDGRQADCSFPWEFVGFSSSRIPPNKYRKH